MSRWLNLAIVVAVVGGGTAQFVGCSSGDTPPDSQGDPDANVDAGDHPDTSTGNGDAHADARQDATQDAKAEAPQDAVVDSSVDATPDVQPDVPPVVDAAPDTTPVVDATPDTTPVVDAAPDVSPVVDAHPDAPVDATPVPDAHPDAVADSAEVGPELDPVRQALQDKSPACLACVHEHCEALLEGVLSITGNAAAGGAAGTPKRELAIETFQCVMTSGCAAATSSHCYCGTAAGATCLTPGSANGVCKAITEKGLETTAPSDVATGLLDDTKGAGRAYEVIGCAQDFACDACF